MSRGCAGVVRAPATTRRIGPRATGGSHDLDAPRLGRSALNPGTVPSALVSISATADGAVFAADTSGSLYCQGVAAEGWIAEPGQLESIAAASDGTVLGLSTGGEMLQLVSGSWQPISPAPPTQPAQVAVGNAKCVWATTSDGTPLSFDGSSLDVASRHVPRAAQRGSDDSVFALDHAGAIFQFANGGWSQIAAPEAMTWISGAQSGWLWATDGQGQPLPVGRQRGVAAGVRASRRSRRSRCGDDGTVLAQDTAGELYAYDGDVWRPMTGPAPPASWRSRSGARPKPGPWTPTTPSCITGPTRAGSCCPPRPRQPASAPATRPTSGTSRAPRRSFARRDCSGIRFRSPAG